MRKLTMGIALLALLALSAPTGVLGLEWPYGSSHLFGELSASGGDLHDAKLMFGWMF